MYILSKKFDQYYAQFRVLHGIKFTIRQIDVLSCMVNARTKYKEIANILGIEVTVVRSHISAIREKVRNSSHTDILQFVESSNLYNEIKSHFIFLVRINEFDALLKGIAKTNSKKKKITIYCNKDSDSELLLSNGKNLGLKKHFTKLGVKIDVRGFLDERNDNFETDNIFIITDELIEQIQKNSRISKDIEFLISNSRGKNIILQLSQKPLPENITKLESTNLRKIDFLSDYCSSFLKLLCLMDFIPKGNLKTVDQFIQNEVVKISELHVSPNGFADENKEPLKNNEYITLQISSKRFFVISIFIMFLFALTYITYISQKQNIEVVSTEEHKTELWNISLLNENIILRHGIVDEIWSKLKHREYENTATSIVGLYGLGGIGKTTLANYIVHHPQKKYSFIGWFNAETLNLLKNDYFNLGIRHNLISQKMSSQQKIYEVKEWLEAQKNILLVFDGVQDINILSKYLPNKGDIIITSRSYNIPNALEVDILSEEESVLMLKNLIADKPINADESEIRSLAKKLDYIPLALSQAGAYIAKNMLSIKEYSSLYDVHWDSLLKDNTMPALDDHKPIHVTWNISIQKLRDHPQGKEPLLLLNFISCCDHSYFSKKFLALFLYGNYDSESMLKLNKVLHFLRNYSFVKTHSNGVIVHNLVHSWVFSNLQNKKKLYIRALSTLKKIHKMKSDGWDKELVRLSLPHFQKIVSASKNYVSSKEYVDLLLMQGDFLFHLNHYNSNSKILKKALYIQENHVNRKDVKVISILNKMIKNYLKLGNYKEGLALVDKALKAEEKVLLEDSIEHAITLGYLGRIYRYLGEYKESEKLLSKALAIEEKHYGKDSRESVGLISNLGATYGGLGDHHKSLKLLEKSLILSDKYFLSDHVQAIYTLNRLGNRYRALGYYDKSLQVLERSLELQRKHFSSDNIVTSYTLRQLGKLYNALGKYNKSLDLITKCVEIEERCIGKDHYYTADPIIQLGIVHRKLGNLPRSLELIKRSYDILRKEIDEDNLKIAYNYHHMALTYRELGDFKTCIDLLKKSLKIKNQIIGAHNVPVAKDLLELGITYKMTNNYDDSFKMIYKANEIFKEFLGDGNIRTISAKKELGSFDDSFSAKDL